MYSLWRIKIGANIIITIPWCIACENGVRCVCAGVVLLLCISRASGNVRVCSKRKFSIFILWYRQREIPILYGVWPCVRCGCCSCFSFSMFFSSFHFFVLFSCVHFSALAKCSCLCVTVSRSYVTVWIHTEQTLLFSDPRLHSSQMVVIPLLHEIQSITSFQILPGICA